MTFQISGLPRSAFADLFALSPEERLARGVETQVADAPGRYPCRVSLADAEPGDELILLNHEHHVADTPYRQRHAIFVRVGAEDVQLPVGQVPEVLARRLLSVRAYDRSGRMIDADVTDGSALAPVIARLFANDEAAYLHVHNAKQGCYAARVDRV